MKGRFFLGLGTGENLNEHVIGRGWPSPDVRLEMLDEAIKAMRLLWEGGVQSFRAATTRSRTPASTRCPTGGRIS